jgi:DNA-binding IclR family transcriptional regulator
MSTSVERNGSWTLLTGHGRVLVEIARDPGARIRDIAAGAGITERAAQAIVADLEAAGYITRTRTGRRVRYTVNRDSLFRHPAQEGHHVGPFLALLARDRNDTSYPDDDAAASGHAAESPSRPAAASQSAGDRSQMGIAGATLAPQSLTDSR